jgi:hypothetical protein
LEEGLVEGLQEGLQEGLEEGLQGLEEGHLNSLLSMKTCYSLKTKTNLAKPIFINIPTIINLHHNHKQIAMKSISYYK